MHPVDLCVAQLKIRAGLLNAVMNAVLGLEDQELIILTRVYSLRKSILSRLAKTVPTDTLQRTWYAQDGVHQRKGIHHYF